MRYLILFLFCSGLYHHAVAQSYDDLYEKGRTAYSNKEYAKAIDYYTQASQVKTTAYPYWGRGSSYWKLFQYEKAILDYTTALQYIDNTKERGSLLLNRADCYFSLPDYRKASEDYKAYLAIVPSNTYAHNQLGRSYLGLSKYDSAEQSFRDAFALSTDPKNKAVYKYNIAYTKREILNYVAAEELLNEAVSLDPEYENAYLVRASVYLVKKKYSLALADYDRLLAKSTTDISKAYYHHRKGLVYWQSGESDKALPEFKTATELDPVNESYWYDLGRFMKTKMNNTSLANSFLQKAIDLSIGADTSSTYGYAKLFLGKPAEAISFMQRKVNGSKGDGDGYNWSLHNMACLYALAGNKTKALEYVSKSIAEGYHDFDHLVNDRDLLSLMNMPEWKAMLAKYKVPKVKL